MLGSCEEESLCFAVVVFSSKYFFSCTSIHFICIYFVVKLIAFVCACVSGCGCLYRSVCVCVLIQMWLGSGMVGVCLHINV